METQGQVFRSGFLQSLWLMGGPISIILLLFTPIYLQVWTWSQLLVFFTVIHTLLTLPLTIFGVWYSKTTILPSGIHGYNAFGLFRTIPWEEMESISLFPIIGLKYLRIHTTNKRWTLWLPLFHLEQRRLEELILSYAPPQHIIRSYIPTKK